jgi:hypothetical protein
MESKDLKTKTKLKTSGVIPFMVKQIKNPLTKHKNLKNTKIPQKCHNLQTPKKPTFKTQHNWHKKESKSTKKSNFRKKNNFKVPFSLIKKNKKFMKNKRNLTPKS